MINRNLVFIDNMQFMKSSLDLLVTNLMSEYFKYLSEEFRGEYLRLVKKRWFILLNTWTVLKNFLKTNCLISLIFLLV